MRFTGVVPKTALHNLVDRFSIVLASGGTPMGQLTGALADLFDRGAR
jgi:hypothetical protein